MKKRQFLWWLCIVSICAHIGISSPLMPPKVYGEGETSGSWVLGTSMNQARIGAAVSVVGDKLYVVGGYQADDPNFNTMEIYNSVSKSWSSGLVMPASHSDAAASVIGNQIYVIGGYDDQLDPTNTMYIYDVTQDKWTTGVSMNASRGSAVAVAFDNKSYVIGGSKNSAMEIYDANKKSWSSGPTMATIRSRVAAGIIGRKIYVVGGRSYTGGWGGEPLSSMEIYDIDHNSWTIGTSMPVVRDYPSSGVINGRLYVAGGSVDSGQTAVNTLLVYDPATDKWTSDATMITPRSATSAGVIGGKLYVAGGYDGKSSLNSLEIYDPGTPPTPTPTPTPKWIESGFDPKVNGFNIHNVNAEVTWGDMLNAYGLIHITDPVLYTWYQMKFSNGTGGLCFGMTLGSAFMNMDPPVPKPISNINHVFDIPHPGTHKTSAGEFLNSGPVHDFLVKYHMYQYSLEYVLVNAFSNKKRMDTIIPAIEGKLKAPVAIEFTNLSDGTACGGHLVLPYAYAKTATGYLVKVYDSNKPGVQDAIMQVNQDETEWHYDDWSNNTTCSTNPDQNARFAAIPLTGLELNQVTFPITKVPILSINAVATGANIQEILPYDVSEYALSQIQHTYIYSSTSPLNINLVYDSAESAKIGVFSSKGYQGVTAYNINAGTQDVVAFDTEQLSTSLDTTASGNRSIQAIVSGLVDSGVQINCPMPSGTHVEFIQNTQNASLKSGTALNDCTFEVRFNVGTRQVYELPSVISQDTFTLTQLENGQMLQVGIDHGSNNSLDNQLTLKPIPLTYIYLPVISR